MNPAPSFNLCDFRVVEILNMKTAKNEKIFKNLTKEGAG